MNSDITEAMIVKFLQGAGGYDQYLKAKTDFEMLRQSAQDMIELFEGNVEKAISFTQEGKNKIFKAVEKRSKK